MDTLKIGHKIMMKRKELAMTQEDLAEYMGVTKAAISKWETGQSYPDITFLSPLASFFDITVDELISYEPQVSDKTVSILYKKFCQQITKENAETVFSEVKSVVKKYFSSYNLLYYLGLFFINHANLCPEKSSEIIGYAREILTRVKQHTKNERIRDEAKKTEAFCYLLLQEPQKTIDLLYEEHHCSSNDAILVSNAFEMLGKVDKAEETLQIALYQTILGMIEKLTLLVNLRGKQKAKALETYHRLIKLIDLFAIENLHPSILFNVYLTGAVLYLHFHEDDRAMEELIKYVALVRTMKGQFVLHSDAFFDKVENYIHSLLLGESAPRSNTLIFTDILQVIQSQPFDRLRSRSDYQQLIVQLKEINHGNNH